MSGVKNVGGKAATPPPQAPEPQPKSIKPESPSSQNTNNHQLTEKGKSAKTSEANMSGEAMRQKMLQEAEDLAKPLVDAWKSNSSSDSADVWGNLGKDKGVGDPHNPKTWGDPHKPKTVGDPHKPNTQTGPQAEVQKARTEPAKTESGPMSPAGVAYKPEARVPDSTPLFTDGKIDREKVLQNLSQHDQSTKTTEDKDRCGGTAVISSAINNGGDAGLLKLTGAMKKNLPSESLKDLNEIEEKIKNKTATHGDLGKLSEMIHKGYAVDDKSGGKGILDGDMHSLYTAAGLKPPASAGLPEKIFQNGQSWPVNLDTDKDGKPNHWVVAGKDEKGRPFIYDPESTPGKPQIHYKGSTEYDNYIKQMKDTNSGFAPITKQQADAAREKYDRENLM